MFKAAIFDVDGTLLDTTEYIFQATEHTLKEHGFDIPDRDYLATFIGGHLKEFYQVIAPGGDYHSIYKTHSDFQLANLKLIKPFPNVLDTLKVLRKKEIKLVALTSRHKTTLIPSLKIAKLFPLLDLIISADDVKNPKPNPEGVLKALKKFNIGRKDAILVGDSKFDILAGKNAGVKTVGATYGFGRNIQEFEPDYVINDIKKVLDIVLSNT